MSGHLERFKGTIEKLCDVDTTGLSDWVLSIPENELSKLSDAGRWEWRYEVVRLVQALLENYPGAVSLGAGLWTMEAGQVHPAHCDEMRHEWLVRLHVPILTNDSVVFTMDDGEHRMKVGTAYKFNALAKHAVANGGKTPRVHFVLDIGKD